MPGAPRGFAAGHKLGLGRTEFAWKATPVMGPARRHSVPSWPTVPYLSLSLSFSLSLLYASDSYLERQSLACARS